MGRMAILKARAVVLSRFVTYQPFLTWLFDGACVCPLLPARSRQMRAQFERDVRSELEQFVDERSTQFFAERNCRKTHEMTKKNQQLKQFSQSSGIIAER